MVQWVKNLTAAASVAAEMRVQSPVRCNGLKNPVLLQLWCRSQEFPYAVGVVLQERKEVGKRGRKEGRKEGKDKGEKTIKKTQNQEFLSWLGG